MWAKKGQQLFFCVRNPSKFEIYTTCLNPYIISTLITCWFGNLSNKSQNSLRIVKVGGVCFDSFYDIFNARLKKKAQSVITWMRLILLIRIINRSNCGFSAPLATKKSNKLTVNALNIFYCSIIPFSNWMLLAER